DGVGGAPVWSEADVQGGPGRPRDLRLPLRAELRGIGRAEARGARLSLVGEGEGSDDRGTVLSNMLGCPSTRWIDRSQRLRPDHLRALIACAITRLKIAREIIASIAIAIFAHGTSG